MCYDGTNMVKRIFVSNFPSQQSAQSGQLLDKFYGMFPPLDIQSKLMFFFFVVGEIIISNFFVLAIYEIFFLLLTLFNSKKAYQKYCRTQNVSVYLYIAYIAFGSASLYIKTLYFFLTVLALSAVAIVANIKIRYDAKIPQFAIFGTRVIYVFYSR